MSKESVRGHINKIQHAAVSQFLCYYVAHKHKEERRWKCDDSSFVSSCYILRAMRRLVHIPLYPPMKHFEDNAFESVHTNTNTNLWFCTIQYFRKLIFYFAQISKHTWITRFLAPWVNMASHVHLVYDNLLLRKHGSGWCLISSKRVACILAQVASIVIADVLWSLRITPVKATPSPCKCATEDTHITPKRLKL